MSVLVSATANVHGAGLGTLSPIGIVLVGFGLYLVAYVVYQRYFHPLAKYPGPFLASLTNFWKAYEVGTLAFPTRLCAVHEKYGSVVRIGPNDLVFNNAEAIVPIYKSGRKMPKGNFYDGFVSTVPDIFSTRDENFHALRMKQLGPGLSVSALKHMEPMFNLHIDHLIRKVEKHADAGTVLEVKSALAFYGYDITSQLAFDTNFDAQGTEDMPPLNKHFLLGNLYGCLADLGPKLRSWSNMLPGVKGLIESRLRLTKIAAESVRNSIKHHNNETEPGTLLAALINAKDPETGAKLTEDEINSEAFVFLVAGSHTTSSAMVALLFFILQNPTIYATVQQEVDMALPGQQRGVYDFTGLETKLPYLFACIRESFRMSPTAALLFPHLVINPAGAQIGEHHVPQGTNCAIMSTCLHHNPEIWGPTHNEFDPSRFVPGSPLYDPSYPNLLLHFGTGNRQCLGRNIAMMSVWKIMVTLFKNFDFELVNPNEKFEMFEYGVADKKGPFNVRVKRRVVN